MCQGVGYIDCGNDASLNSTDTVAIESWFWLSDVSGYKIILSKWGSSSRSYQMIVCHNKICMHACGESGYYTHVSSDQTLPVKEWIHAFGKYNGDYIEMYVNGVPDGTPVELNEKIHIVPTNVEIGGRTFAGREDPMNGFIATVRLYAGEDFMVDEIHDLALGRKMPTDFNCVLWHDYRLGHANDLTRNNNHGVIHNFIIA